MLSKMYNLLSMARLPVGSFRNCRSAETIVRVRPALSGVKPGESGLPLLRSPRHAAQQKRRGVIHAQTSYEPAEHHMRAQVIDSRR
jgi:hypothetical protein